MRKELKVNRRMLDELARVPDIQLVRLVNFGD